MRRRLGLEGVGGGGHVSGTFVCIVCRTGVQAVGGRRRRRWRPPEPRRRREHLRSPFGLLRRRRGGRSRRGSGRLRPCIVPPCGADPGVELRHAAAPRPRSAYSRGARRTVRSTGRNRCPARRSMSMLLVDPAGNGVELEPQAGTANAWITSAPVVCMRIGTPTGTTMRLSTARCSGSPALVGFLVGQHVRDHLEPAVVGIGVAPVPLVAGGLDRQRVLGRRACTGWRAGSIDGTAMTTRISTGTTVQMISISVLWLVFDGTGLARRRNLNITYSSRPSTNRRDHGDDRHQHRSCASTGVVCRRANTAPGSR